ncbi:beta-N-acetylhexosaminidase [Clostridium oryzae]|uniref:beta-N-acetylhexosaminidase n=1 Tax=Clostridium oryzae TaxID=1450648 RepID=A0A1V4IXA9_9CLOT|nr:glycoside hydrolase family 20 zincin-like fold domain-containing protein [Clostridium oryzae]OPJ64586.1 beta-hexosaminidase [Clostridium oryzae]
MFLIPEPQRVKYLDEKGFIINRDTEIVLDCKCNFNHLGCAKQVKTEIKANFNLDIKINKGLAKDQEGIIYLNKKTGKEEGYSINIDKNIVEIIGNDDAGLFYGVQTFCQILRQSDVQLPNVKIDDAPYYKQRGFYHDVTRGKVPKLETLKRLADRLSFYKINQLQLYIEHSFAFKNMSEIWMNKDPLTAEEILELDEYCSKKNIELVPSLSTFGHLYEALRSEKFKNLCELNDPEKEQFSYFDRMAHHTLNVSNDKSIEFVRNMLKEFIPLFSSNKFNICCDETFDIGKGKSSKLAREYGADKLYVDFLKKIVNEVKVYDKQIMFWGDIILKTPELLKELPKDIICLNWDYSKDVTDHNVRVLSEANVTQFVCPGVGGWNRMMNYMDGAFNNIRKMISYGKKYGAVGVLNTDWGDFGHINLLANSMPGMIYGADLSWNPDDKREFDDIDRAISIIEFGENCKDIIGTIRELSNEEIAAWPYIIYFADCKMLNRKVTYEHLEGLNKIDSNRMLEGYHNALKLEEEITRKGRSAKSSRVMDIEEFINSARGVALMNAVCLAIKKYELGHDEIKLPIDNNKLAIELEYWFVEFSSLWRRRNKESELYRIRDVISFICSFLRKHIGTK